MVEDSGIGDYLLVYPEYNEKGEPVKDSGFSNVLRDCFKYERENENISISFNVEKCSITVLDNSKL